jgi:hypothetical protein
MTTRSDINKQLAAVRIQLAAVQGWHLDSSLLAVARCDALVSLTEKLRDMVLDHVANPPKKTLRPLGKEKLGFLKACWNHGPYSHAGCGWLWGGRAPSARLAESLKDRGLLVRDGDRYLLTAEGRRLVEQKT